jgi:death on curing protein
MWLSVAVLLAVHEDLLARFGGLPGIRDEGLLQSALHRPRNRFAYEQPTLFTLATDYALGTVKNHPFLDGNKRAGFMAAYIFLGANGVDISAPEEEVVVYTLGLAAGEIGAVDYAGWLERSSGL